jgi:predicted nucleic acid-binding protein
VRRVFVDTGGFFALLVAEDRNHAHARELFRLSERLVRTRFVVEADVVRHQMPKVLMAQDQHVLE